MPANGNAGWIDEAIATWRDNGYVQRPPDPDRVPVNLAGFSPYMRHTPMDAYYYGSLLLSELDYMFEQGGSGLRPMLSKLYLQKRRQQITTEYFKAFLEAESGQDFGPMFSRFVYGQKPDKFLTFDEVMSRQNETAKKVMHDFEAAAVIPPRRPFTREELNALR
jgi:hypothetical protein